MKKARITLQRESEAKTVTVELSGFEFLKRMFVNGDVLAMSYMNAVWTVIKVEYPIE